VFELLPKPADEHAAVDRIKKRTMWREGPGGLRELKSCRSDRSDVTAYLGVARGAMNEVVRPLKT